MPQRSADNILRVTLTTNTATSHVVIGKAGSRVFIPDEGMFG
jgi:hypothetical protein